MSEAFRKIIYIIRRFFTNKLSESFKNIYKLKSTLIDNVDYAEKVNGMINEGIRQGKYEMTTDTTHRYLEKFQSFLYRNFKSHPSYNDMRPVSNQPPRFFATAKPINLMTTLR